jgi:hypothetical protein
VGPDESMALVVLSRRSRGPQTPHRQFRQTQFHFARWPRPTSNGSPQCTHTLTPFHPRHSRIKTFHHGRESTILPPKTRSREHRCPRPGGVMSCFLAHASRIASEFHLTAKDIQLGTDHFVRQLSTNNTFSPIRIRAWY